DGKLRRWDVTGGILQRRLGVPNRADEQVRPIDRGCARDDAVVVVWIALRLSQSLAAAGGAASKVRLARRRAVERLDDLFAFHGHLVNRSVAEVDDELRVAERE